jgi:hypothetical protein
MAFWPQQPPQRLSIRQLLEAFAAAPADSHHAPQTAAPVAAPAGTLRSPAAPAAAADAVDAAVAVIFAASSDEGDPTPNPVKDDGRLSKP